MSFKFWLFGFSYYALILIFLILFLIKFHEFFQITLSFKLLLVEEAINYVIENGGRPNAPKVLLVVTDENFKQFANISSIDVTMIVSISTFVDKYQFY